MGGRNLDEGIYPLIHMSKFLHPNNIQIIKEIRWMEVKTKMKKSEMKSGILVFVNDKGMLYLGVTEKKESDLWQLHELDCINEDGDISYCCHSTAFRYSEERLVPIVDVSKLSFEERSEIIKRFLRKIILMRQLKQEQLLSL